jgi:hypothetical protein
MAVRNVIYNQRLSRFCHINITVHYLCEHLIYHGDCAALSVWDLYVILGEDLYNTTNGLYSGKVLKWMVQDKISEDNKCYFCSPGLLVGSTVALLVLAPVHSFVAPLDFVK